MTNNLKGGLTKHEILAVGQSLRRCNDDRISSVNSKRVKVLHITNSNTVVTRIPNDLILQLLPSSQILINDDLITRSKGLGSQVSNLIVVGGKSTPESTKSICGTDQDGVSNLVSNLYSLVDRICTVREGNTLTNLSQLLREDFTIFSSFDSGHLGTQNLNTSGLELARVPELNSNIEGSLTTHGYDDTIGLFLLDDVHHNMSSDGEEVHLVGSRCGLILLSRSLNGGNVGVNKNDLNTLLLECLDTL